MKTKTIILRKNKIVTSQSLRIKILCFFRYVKFNSNYTSIYVQLISKGNRINIGNKIILDVTDKAEIYSYLELVSESFSKMTKNNLNISASAININYIETNKEAYEKYINNLSRLENFGLDDNSNPSRNYSYTKNSFNSLIGKRFYSSKYSFFSNNKLDKFTLGKWYDYNYELKNNILLPIYIEQALKDFWINIVEKIDSKQYLLLQFKIITDENITKSISYVLTANKTDLDRIILIFKEYWDLVNEDYHQFKINSINLSYKILLKKGSMGESKLPSHKKVELVNNIPFKLGGYNLPTTMDITKWSGNVQFNSDYSSAIVYLNQSVREYHVSLFDKYQIVKVVVNNETLLEFTDKVDNVYDLSTFTRIFKNKSFVFINGELVVKQIKRKVNFLTKLNKDSSISNKFITMDLETRNINGILQPYCVSIYYLDSDGLERAQSFYLRYYSSPDKMLESAITSLFNSKFDGYIIYLHNFSNFDGIFLLRVLARLSNKIKPIIRDGKIIDLTVNFRSAQNKGTIHFRDSYLILTQSLADLANDFKVEFKKGIFPYKFVDNPEIDLSYKGKFPDIKYFENITLEQYIDYCFRDKYWDLEYETKMYCELDCKVLYLVLKKFAELIFEHFQIDINKHPTLPSITMAIFRSNFLKVDYKIPLIDGIIYKELKKGYTGGMVDVYKPTNEAGTEVNSYDVNSLYPYSMHYYSMPVGNPIYFEGEIFKVNPNAFGIFEVEIIAPKDLNYPILQTKVKINNSYKTISPLGNWSGWYFSSELINAINSGYSIKVHRGYLFEKGYIFKEFVEILYNIKANSKKGTPLYTITKLLLNSLYGKFGIDPNYDKHVILDSNKSQEYHHKYIVTNVINLGNKELISYFDNSTEDNKLTQRNSSLPIAMAVTAYARMHMNQLKKAILALGFIIYYMDTDCLAISGKLDPKYIGSDLGKLKLEHIFRKVVYLAPKVYAGKAENYEYVKVKGLKNHISFEQIEPLLIKNNSLILNQEKSLKNISAGHISIKKELYTLMITENKRQLIFNKDNVFVDTKPFVVSNGEVMQD